MKTYKVIGLMSGTSLDGVDIAYCEFGLNDNKWSFEIGAAETMAYSNEWIKNLGGLPQKSAEELLKYDIRYGSYLGELVNSFAGRNKVQADLIASHGHTIFHQPENKFTYQLGNGQALAKQTGLKAVSDFRSKDVLYGGQGAPLVPIGDELLFGSYAGCLNLGGFSNLSYRIYNKRIAYDICTVNMALNHISRMMGHDYDEDGKLAASGKTEQALLNALNATDFYKLNGPKSLGREWFLKEFLPLFENTGLQPNNLMRTMTEHIAIQISKAINRVRGKILITGGGALNKFLIARIRSLSANELEIPDETLVSYKEALVFALLGVLRIRNEVNCLASVSGASMDTVCGTIHIP